MSCRLQPFIEVSVITIQASEMSSIDSSLAWIVITDTSMKGYIDDRSLVWIVITGTSMKGHRRQLTRLDCYYKHFYERL
jgi:hypothetical protein